MSVLIKGDIKIKPFKVLILFLARINRSLARRNRRNNPQLVVFSFDHIGLSINLDGRYENEELLLASKFIEERLVDSKKKVALDIGANIGNHSVFLSRYFREVHSFEPNPVTYEVLRINSKYAASSKNIIPHSFGLSDTSGKLKFKLDRDNIGGSRVADKDDLCSPCSEIIDVDVRMADDLVFLRDREISLIKIDVEGHELSALKGASEIISHSRPVILFEQDASQIVGGSSEVIDYLASKKYSFYTIEKRFYFGENVVLRLMAFLIRSLLGEQLILMRREQFDVRHYAIVFALPSSD